MYLLRSYHSVLFDDFSVPKLMKKGWNHDFSPNILVPDVPQTSDIAILKAMFRYLWPSLWTFHGRNSACWISNLGENIDMRSSWPDRLDIRR